MFAAIQRLVLITVGSLILTFFAILFVRWAGQQQVFSEPPHPWFSIATWTVKNPNLDKLCEALKLTESTTDSDLVWLPVKFVEGSWRVKCDKDVRVSQVLGNSTQLNWLLFVDAHETARLDSLVDDLAAFNKHAIGIFSPSQSVARYLRKKAPQWVYAADAATLLRLHVFASFWIETSFDFWPDFVVQTPGDKNSQFSEREMNELQRRKKRVIQVDLTP